MPEPSPERGAAGAAGSDHVERALLAAHDLIESVVTRHRQDQARQSWVRAGPGRPSAAEAADRLIAGAERTVAVVLSGDPEQEDAVCAALARPPRPGREGVAVRLLCLPGALAGPGYPRWRAPTRAVRRGRPTAHYPKPCSSTAGSATYGRKWARDLTPSPGRSGPCRRSRSWRTRPRCRPWT
ncbi:hypothetical protein SAZ11_36035 [Streptomyces sp. FXJ1.4098]|nr:hypothetical protein [Streptomyces sp. FXJ1.4098]